MVGGEWIVSGGRLVQGMYGVKSSKSCPPWQHGITIFQGKCRKRGLKVMSRISFFCKSGFLNVVMWLFVDVLRPFMIKDLYRKMWVIFESEICFHHNIQKHASLLKRMLTCIVKDTFCTRVVKHYRDTVKESGLQEMWEKPNMHVESNVSRYLVCQKMVLEVIFPLPRWCSGEL